ncbi:hypothetical protein SARC_08794 [Sphaeroforma arctica JP610]|uniref:Uncharacterized protein n=1 Tax=Sphaeroforma arctica JP610 TaxID=667725 RepID=A0A0L0FPY6_9EUKA|nr:hypothetical protein SARC_08794 [Sphaeroforma arctica JP610]KNC78779.1 hypothetical protein SARC_08794 [Sphaeroforma arctica JP610]|eukprot:XP_014152681.1 hypothetical protein SARC_08794 [Sphaeroforma arctica JP610]
MARRRQPEQISSAAFIGGVVPFVIAASAVAAGAAVVGAVLGLGEGSAAPAMLHYSTSHVALQHQPCCITAPAMLHYSTSHVTLQHQCTTGLLHWMGIHRPQPEPRIDNPCCSLCPSAGAFSSGGAFASASALLGFCSLSCLHVQS